MKIKISDVKSEITRLALSLKEALDDPYMAELSKVRAIITRIDKHLYNVADRCTHTELRREMVENLDRIQHAAERFLSHVDTAAQDEVVLEALETLSGVTFSWPTNRTPSLSKIVNEEVARVKRSLIVEDPQVQPGDVQKIANDSVDVKLDAYFQKSADTLDATGSANKEKTSMEDGGEGEQNFSVVDFASDIANLVDRTNTLLDLDGTIARRAYNHVAEKYGPDAAENLKQVLSANFDINIEASGDMEGERFADRPAAIGAGGGAEGVQAGGGGSSGEGAP